MRNAHVGAGHALFFFIQIYMEVPAAHEIAYILNLEETARAYLLFISRVHLWRWRTATYVIAD
jgi:hypothetical protein